APAPARGLDHGREGRLLGDVGREREAFSARLSRHHGGLLGGGKIVVDGEHLGALLNEPQHRGAAIAHALARRLTAAHHDGDLVLEPHGRPRWTTPRAYGNSANETSRANSIDPARHARLLSSAPNPKFARVVLQRRMRTSESGH